MLWTGDCPSARVHGLLLAWKARLSMGDTFFGAWQRNRSTGGTRQRRKRCAAEQTAAVSLNRSLNRIFGLPGQSLGYSKQTEGDGPPSHTLHRPTPAPALSRPRSAAQRRLFPTHSLTYSHTLSLTPGWPGRPGRACGRLTTGPTAGGWLRRRHASAFTKYRGSVIIQDDSGFFQVISSSWPRCGPAANNGGAMGTAGTAQRWTAWGHWSMEQSMEHGA